MKTELVYCINHDCPKSKQCIRHENMPQSKNGLPPSCLWSYFKAEDCQNYIAVNLEKES
jgi:hypothetical protein